MNKKGVIFNSIVAGLGLFTIIFMALPYASIASGFDMMSAAGGVYTIGGVFTLIAGIVMLAGGIIGLLCDANVIKSETVKKVFRIITLVAVILATVASVLVLVMFIVDGIISVVGFGLILNLIFAIGALVCGILGFKA